MFRAFIPSRFIATLKGNTASLSFYFADDDILTSIHRLRPKCLVTSAGLPSYYDPYEFEHTCLLKCQCKEEEPEISTQDEHDEPASETRKCLSVPFVPRNNFQNNDVAEELATVIKEVKPFWECVL